MSLRTLAVAVFAACFLTACSVDSHGGQEYDANGSHRHLFRDTNGGELIVVIAQDQSVSFACSPGFHVERELVGQSGAQFYACYVNPEPQTTDMVQ